MVKKSFISFFIALIAIAFMSCDKTVLDDYQPEFGYEYFPIEIGKYRTYVVDSIVYDIGDNGIIDTTHSRTFEKHVVTDTITDNLGRIAFKVERYTRPNETFDWEIRDVWTTIRTNEGAEWIEENLRFLKMVFPLKEGLDWDGNQFIDVTTIIPIAGESVEVFKSWDYEALTINENEVINDMVFDSVATISQADSENLIELRQSEEKYAKGIGLVYREMAILDTQCISECDGWTWIDKAEKGFILTQQIVDYN